MAEGENILTKLQDLLVYLMPQINKFPRDQRFEKVSVNGIGIFSLATKRKRDNFCLCSTSEFVAPTNHRKNLRPISRPAAMPRPRSAFKPPPVLPLVSKAEGRGQKAEVRGRELN